jgi:hypothetical protein
MSHGVIDGIVRAADIDTRLALQRAGYYVPPRKLTLPNLTLPVWTGGGHFYSSLSIGQFEITWYPVFGVSAFMNMRTRKARQMEVFRTMKVSYMRGNWTLGVKIHPDYLPPCKCGCGYNMNRNHVRILPRPRIKLSNVS